VRPFCAQRTVRFAFREYLLKKFSLRAFFVKKEGKAARKNEFRRRFCVRLFNLLKTIKPCRPSRTAPSFP
jgi:hypothetical protein